MDPFNNSIPLIHLSAIIQLSNYSYSTILHLERNANIVKKDFRFASALSQSWQTPGELQHCLKFSFGDTQMLNMPYTLITKY